MQTDHLQYSASAASFGKACDAPLMQAFNDTYYPIFRNNCAHCHGGSGPGIGQFAEADFNQAFLEFENVGRKAVEGNFTNPNHQPPYTGTQNQPIVDAAQAEWQAAEASAATCNAGTSTPGPSSKTMVLTTNKSNSAIYLGSAPYPFKTLTWNLSTDVQGAAIQGKIMMTFSIDVHLATDNNQIVGYEFRNPTIALSSGATGTYHIQGIHVVINGQVQNETTYMSVNTDVTSTTAMNLAQGSAYSLVAMTTAMSDQFGIEFDEILDANGQPITTGTSGSTSGSGGSTTNTTAITFTNLNNAASSVGVFANSCVACHSAGNPQGGLDLTNYSQAKSLASQILSRMKSTTSPMPPTGQLSSSDIQVVNTWVQNGEPQ